MSDQHNEVSTHQLISSVVVATTNEGKIREIEGLLGDLGWELRALGDIVMPEENGATFEENAALKACAACMQTGLPALADDSGLEVDALNGEPGIMSARFGNRKNSLERNVYLLERLRKHEDRRARFVSVVVLAYPDGHIETYRGEVTGQILYGPRGEGGFGYDPLFVADGQTRSMGELSMSEKQAISHRGRALQELKQAHISGEAQQKRPQARKSDNRLN